MISSAEMRPGTPRAGREQRVRATAGASSDRVAGVARIAISWIAVLAALLPLAYVLRVALLPDADFVSDPSGIAGGVTLDHLGEAWGEGGLGDAFVNSMIVVVPGALLATVLGTLAGFALAVLEVPFGRVVFALAAIALAIPLPAIVMPLFSQAQSLHLANSRLGLAVIYGGVFAAWITVFMRMYFSDFPRSLIEAARIDGCTQRQLFLRVVVPMAAPAIATALVISLFTMWGELLLALVMLPAPEHHTVSVTVSSFATEQLGASPTTAMAAVLAAVPVLVLFFGGQRFLAFGGRAGAVKG